ncbi:hypothetical protein [Nakamurella lactea]|uniref:hypothetical protein n=1 Tax=Nakamurella lactea TaxID=459515 RepID=UPI0012B61D9C|nr:hypothetical protein [Nakamurella lactea]
MTGTRNGELIHAVTRWTAGTITADRDGIADVVAGLGRQYGWPWWNVLLAQPALRQLGRGEFAVAATADVWSLIGHTPAAGPIDWLTPSITLTRSHGPARPAMPRGAGAPGGLRSWRRRTPGDLAGSQVWIEATHAPDPRPYVAGQLVERAREAARIESVLLPRSAQPFEIITRTALQLLASGVGDPEHCPAPVLVGLPQVRPAPATAVAAAAAWAVLAAHRVTLPLLPAGTPDDIAAAFAVAVQPLDWAQSAALGARTLHSISELLQTLLGMLGRPPWNGGLLTLASTGDGRIPAPRLSDPTSTRSET